MELASHQTTYFTAYESSYCDYPPPEFMTTKRGQIKDEESLQIALKFSYCWTASGSIYIQILLPFVTFYSLMWLVVDVDKH